MLRMMCVGRKGGPRTAVATVDAIERWQPRYVILFGIAAVIPGDNRKKGDILVAEEILDFEELQKGRKDVPRPHVCPCEDALVDHIREHFAALVESKALHVGAILAQPNLIRNARYRDSLVKHARSFTNGPVIGLEMEGGGLATAIRTRSQERRPGVLLIKGGVDWGNYHKDDRLQKLVALKVVRFMKQVLASEPIATRRSGRRLTAGNRTRIRDVQRPANTYANLGRRATVAASWLMGIPRIRKAEAGQDIAALALLALESSPVPIWIGDRDLRIVYMNPALADLLGVIREDYIGKRRVEDLVKAAVKFADRAEKADFRRRQFRIGAAFRRGEWHQGEDVVTLRFDTRLRPGGRRGPIQFRIVASRIEAGGRWLGGIAFFQEMRSKGGRRF